MTDWAAEVYAVMGVAGIDLVATVPDAGLSRLLTLCEEDPGKDVVTLTTEEEGVGLLAGAWLGGRRAVLLMQSSGIGNIVNALTLPGVCEIPCLMLVTMRGQAGEFNPWQVPMGERGPRVLAEVGVTCRDVHDAAAVAPAFAAAAEAAFTQGRAEAVLVAQSIIGTKSFAR